MMKQYALLALLCLSGAPAAKAQQTLSLEQCRTMALASNKEMAAAARQTDAARYTARSYKGLFFPNLTARATGLYSTADGGYHAEGGQLPVFAVGAGGVPSQMPMFAYFPGLDLNYKVGAMFLGGIQLEQPLYTGGKIRSAYRTAQLGNEMAQMNETLTGANVILQTDNAYAQVVKAMEMKKVAERYNALLAELFRNVESARKHGLKLQNDVLKVQVKLNESELALRKADNALRLATMNLCHLIGRPLDDDISVNDGFPETEQCTEPTNADISARPEYALLEKREEMAQQQIRLTRSELLPTIGLQGSLNYLYGLELNNEPLFDKGNFTVLLNVSLPIYHFGERTHKVKAARARLEQTRLERENLNEQMLLELTQATNNLDEARMECTLAGRSLEQAEENLRVSKSQFDAGLEPLSEHLEAQALWQQAYETSVEARYQLYLSHVKYRKAAGTLYSQRR